MLHNAASQVGALDVGFKASGLPSGAAPKVLYLLGAEATARPSPSTFVIYQGVCVCVCVCVCVRKRERER